MKKKIVLWGSDGEDKKILIGMELIEQDNNVKIYTYDEGAATEAVFSTLMNQWRLKDETVLPEGYQVQDRPLSVTDDLLPEDIKVERTDLISQAKAEWHFIVLSSKLYEMYGSELEDFKEKVDQLEQYSESMWEEMKTFWGKVQEQVREKNLFREHASDLREKTNGLFDKLKSLKKTFQSEFKKQSAETAAKYKEELAGIEEKIEKGLGLKPIFDQLKALQARFKNDRFTKEDQRRLWNRIDKAFKAAKEKRFGDKGQSSGALNRIQRRYDGLMGAMGKMQRSIDRDHKDLDWENKRIERTDGQLEMQIRQAKIGMIKERINSKQEKVDDMQKTKLDLEKKIEKEKKREAARAEKEKAKEVKKELKQKIANEIKEAEQARADKADELEDLASKISEGKKKATDSTKEAMATATDMASEATEQVEDAVENAVDTVKAAAEVVEDMIEKKVDQIKDKLQDIADDPEVQEIKEQVSNVIGGALAAFNNIADKVEDKIEEIVDDVTGEEE